MKIRLQVSEEIKKQFLESYQNHTLEFDEEGELILSEVPKSNSYLLCKDEEKNIHIKITDIQYLESNTQEIFVYTQNHVYKTKSKLYELEELLRPYRFMRIHHSYIVNLDKIARIKTALNMKFILIMNNDHKVEVSRSYYYLFKETMNF